MRRVERAEEIRDDIKGYLTAAAIDTAHVTLDVLEVPSALAVGSAVVIQPPDFTFVTAAATDATWELHVISGPVQDTLTAWKRIDAIIDALEAPLDLIDAKTAMYQHPNLPDHPAYIISFNETI
ncbi:hypothetical protein [Paenarthrobacter ilicis]|uniref:hypothetical protein n=1 Tax=Paenarthrobacter ilicis TaxID=43665 RepID=UPI00386F5F09